MFYLLVLLVGLFRLFVSRVDFQQSFVEITVPEKILSNSSDSNSEYEEISYVISVERKPYTLQLKQRLFIPEDFIVYMYNREGALYYKSDIILKHCNYQGHVAGSPKSVVTLHTCSGLRGLLQFENVTYGIEPLQNSGGFQHLIYRLRSENTDLAFLAKKNTHMKSEDLEHKLGSLIDSRSISPNLSPQYVEMHIVLDKSLYDYMGSDTESATYKIIQILGLINAMYSQLKVTIVLSSLEFWIYENKISTIGEPDEILQRFLEWKNSYLVLRPHDMAYLFLYRENPITVGATFPGKMCILHYAAGIVLYPKGITVEAFSVIIAQLLGISLGIKYDSKKCRCFKSTCVMRPEAVFSSGIKVFSQCSLNDFQNFISKTGATCLKNQPNLKISARANVGVCGNYIVEEGETCDCGPPSACGTDKCCDPKHCTKKYFAHCLSGVCCKEDCKFNDGGMCRPSYDLECDFPEICNGSSESCPIDLKAVDGSPCSEFSSMCFGGSCQDPNKQCQRLFGRASKNGPFACYEEINSQQDRFGNCGRHAENKFAFCNWRNLLCGKLICTYPYRKPYIRENVAVIYSYVLNTVCISLDHKFKQNVRDPMLISNGIPCDVKKFCFNSQCVFLNRVIEAAKTCSKMQCNSHGACTDNKRVCICESDYKPPNCLMKRSRTIGDFLPWKSENAITRSTGHSKKNWLILSFYIFLPIIFIVTIIATKWITRKGCKKAEDSLITESGSEFSTLNSYSSDQ
ncbi:disintegrin and metalloproteinase domain-containing protein 32-like [Gracilinanus agilis]|uniref:disintegrin and metalloproteinase domain-containing protein 32-like n=1 Tax=Gracilinanus agilis TaxID=191870 RepID=UPI001CFE653F|nr:disintegrin and metalloproteinase domain-containing protein 32-like [Gracilinanus agilis]